MSVLRRPNTCSLAVSESFVNTCRRRFNSGDHDALLVAIFLFLLLYSQLFDKLGRIPFESCMHVLPNRSEWSRSASEVYLGDSSTTSSSDPNGVRDGTCGKCRRYCASRRICKGYRPYFRVTFNRSLLGS